MSGETTAGGLCGHRLRRPGVMHEIIGSPNVGSGAVVGCISLDNDFPLAPSYAELRGLHRHL